ncbi:hypothetical protein GALMADRAFT_146049 [Galerina marginata CBS 339.88]|uniref:UvrD-like helicase ATP-binding domain-containing protein n=1 Tax=Galerina marginata (strain CBS 339.88) TaxID=685588 RepID=A0A067SCN1_GALM3|nr:hypothetical protein GALMADRAFT_146049 [Galerina marginata CBS 339.88]
MSQIRKVTYRAGLFDAKNLITTENIYNALDEFAAAINQSNHVQALDDVLEQSHIVELVLSGNDDIPLQAWILEQFPTSESKAFETSFSCKLLSRLSKSFLFYPSADESIAALLRNHHQTVRLAPEVLQALFDMTLLGDAHQGGPNRVGAPKKFKTKSSQRETKLAGKAARKFSFNEELFTLIDVPVPQTSFAAATATTALLSHLKSILAFYLTGIRTPEIFNTIKESFIPQRRPAELRIVTEPLTSTDDSPPLAPTTDIPAAFPMVQPMKSALYFDSPEGFGAWRILVSSRANKNLREYRRKGKKSFEIIVKKIKELSEGHFSNDNQKRLNGPTTEVPIFEAKMTGDLRLVYQIDCIPEYDADSEVQVVRIFGIYTHAQMDNRLWDYVASQLGRRGREYRERCVQRRSSDKGNVYQPASFHPASRVEKELEEHPIERIPDLAGDDANQLHKILTLEKYITLSQELLDSIEADRDVAFPFEVSGHERTIIQYPSSCYVLGRSGTGKTTTMLFKMLWIERAYRIIGDDFKQPRQVFVTQSRVLAGKVEELFATYFASLATSNASADTRLANLKITGDEIYLKNEDDDADWRSDLPRRFSELDDKHFPLFITVDRLYALIEADLDCGPGNHELNNMLQTQSSVLSPQSASPRGTRGKLVTFDRFLGEYWPHFTQSSLKKKLSPSSVFSEIMGVIKGSLGTLTSADGYLDRQKYEALSFRTQPAFANHRSEIYNIFESYQKIKNSLGDFDASDRTRDVFRSLTKKTLAGQKFDHLYVDEAQDNLLVDALVLRMLCRNPDGLFWAGDTAQTISAGSSFRFDDLKGLMFKFEVQRNLHLAGFVSIRHKPKQPKMFHLAVNYRSHAGIVNCAHSVIELIQEYWPNTIDILAPERGIANGAVPIFYQDIYPEFIRGRHFLSRDTNSRERIELGADQCIIVRNDAAKERLEDEMGKIGLILTIYDSKGLEFNDVFLYNFFHDSTVDVSQWRVVLNAISSSSAQERLSTPKFDVTRHAAICSELKSLYVAITRARNNLRIADESLKGEPMRNFWESRDQIRSCSPDDVLSDFAASSTMEAWAKRAKELFDNQRYALARDSYEKAQKTREASMANAFYLRQVAERTATHRQRDSANNRRNAFKVAAEAFSSCARDTSVHNAKKYYYSLSAGCFEDSGDSLSAAQGYRLAENFTKAARLLYKEKAYEELHDIIIQHGDRIDGDLLETIQDVTRLHFVTRKEFGKAHQLFATVDEEIEYLGDRDLNLAQLDLLLLHGRKTEAANLHLSEGRILEAIDLFIEHNSCEEESMKRAKESVFSGLWQHFSLGGLPLSKQEVPEISQLLDRLNLLDPNSMDQNDLREIEMFRTIASADFHKLSELAATFLDTGNKNAALLCFDYHFTQIPSFKDADIVEMSRTLTQFFDYIHILHDLAFLINPAIDKRVWTLFAIKPDEQENHFVVPSGTLIHCHVSPKRLPEDGQDAALILSGEELLKSFRKCMQDRLLDRVTRENDMCRKAPALFPCLRHIAFGDCEPLTCPLQHGSPDPSLSNQWLEVHLLQVLIYQSIYNIQSRAEMRAQQKFWIGKLHEALNPPYYLLGSSRPLDVDGHPNLRIALTVLIDWVRTVAYDLEYRTSSPESFLSVVMQTADFAFKFDKKEASTYMYRSKFVASSSYIPPRYIREESRQNSLRELLLAFNGKEPSSLLMGVLFIRHVMDASIYIDINVFSAFIERICGLLIVFNQYRWNKTFHGVVLPRSWLNSILLQFDPIEASCQHSGRYWLLLQPLKMLLEALYSSYRCGHLLYGPEMCTIASQDNKIRSVYISRICRVLGLLGYNIKHGRFQAEIHATVTSLRFRPHRGFSRLYSGYVNAQTFGGIIMATRRSLDNSPVDELVQLFFSDLLRFPVCQVSGLPRRLVYTNQEDILPLLKGKLSDQSRTPSPVHPDSNLSHSDIEAQMRDEDQDDDDQGIDDVDIGEDQNFIPETEIPEELYRGHSEEELSAASLIQRKCRIVLERRRLFENPGLEGAIRRWFVLCSKNFQEGRSPSYKIRFLCFIPPLLCSLEALHAAALKKKIKLRKRLRPDSVGSEPLEEVGPALTRLNSLIKGIKLQQHALEPQSDLHQRCNVDELSHCIQEVLRLLFDRQLPVRLPEDVAEKLQFVHLGIQEAQKPESTKKGKRPELNTEDVGNFAYVGDCWENDQELDYDDIEPSTIDDDKCIYGGM